MVSYVYVNSWNISRVYLCDQLHRYQQEWLPYLIFVHLYRKQQTHSLLKLFFNQRWSVTISHTSIPDYCGSLILHPRIMTDYLWCLASSTYITHHTNHLSLIPIFRNALFWLCLLNSFLLFTIQPCNLH